MDNDRIARNLKCVERHFHSEAADEVEAALDLYTDDIIWEAPALNGLDRSFSGKQAVAKNYRELFASMRNVRFEFLQRFATEDRVVDDSIVTFEIARAGYWPWAADTKIEMRLVHIFEMREGKISRELVFDMGRPVLRRDPAEQCVEVGCCATRVHGVTVPLGGSTARR
jgi:ketosteroid isomerase-like protein